MSDYSARILPLIEQKNVSYSELAKMTGIPKSALQRYATGETEKIPLDRIEKIAAALGVSAAYLMGWDEIAHEKPVAQNDGLSETAKQLYTILQNLDEDDLRRVLDFVLGVISK